MGARLWRGGIILAFGVLVSGCVAADDEHDYGDANYETCLMAEAYLGRDGLLGCVAYLTVDCDMVPYLACLATTASAEGGIVDSSGWVNCTPVNCETW